MKPALFALLLAATALGGALSAPAPPPVDFDREVRPVLAEHCFACHGFDGAKRQAALRLDTSEGAVAPLPTGHRAVVPGQPEKSELVRRVASRTMPPPGMGKRLTDGQLALLRRWVQQGAKYERHWSLVPPGRPPVPGKSKVRSKKAKDGADWAWLRNPIDAFVLARLEREGLKPSPEADPRTLIRRVTLDLSGLPPTPGEVEAFVRECQAESGPTGPHPPAPSPVRRGGVPGSTSRRLPLSAPGRGPGGGVPAARPSAYDRLVDRLLASPRYGEHMAWDWLDAARYADTNGYQGDRTRTLWPWRDWVIAALNADMPFDQFTVQQLAGDLLPLSPSPPLPGSSTLVSPALPYVPMGSREATLIATGFNRNHMLNGEGGRIPEESRVDYVVDRVDTTATVWMGLTVGCARCHDHKFDPVTQRDYYRLYAYFNNLPETGSVDRRGNANPVLLLPTPEQQARLGELEAKAKELEKQLAGLPPEAPERAGLQKQLDDAKKAQQEAEDRVLATMVMQERPEPRESFVLIRGAYDRLGEKVTPGTPGCLPALPAEAPPNRLALARWLVDPSNPLTARVTVNRAWQQFFGTGLVKTAEDFGVQGERPTHPELLDWLAVAFQSGDGLAGEHGSGGVGTYGSGRTGLTSSYSHTPTLPHSHTPRPWSLKSLHRLIVTSATYRQSSRVTPALLERDPENRLLARGARFRLPSPVLRDQALALSGLLVEKLGGPPVKPYQPEGVWEDATFGKITYQQDHGEALYRRTLYTFWRRIVGPTNLFDTAARQTCTVRQARTNTPLHALTLLNDVTYVEAARVFAQRIMLAGGSPEVRVETAFRTATGRAPAAAERAVLLSRWTRLRERYAADPTAAKQLLSTGESPRDERLDPADHAALTGVCSVILNLDEVVTKE